MLYIVPKLEILIKNFNSTNFSLETILAIMLLDNFVLFYIVDGISFLFIYDSIWPDYKDTQTFPEERTSFIQQ